MSAVDSHLELTIRDDDPWIVAKHAFNIIAAYVQPNSASSATETAVALDALTPTKRHLREGEVAEESTSFLLEFWETTLVLVRQVPHDSPSQERLVELVRGLMILPHGPSEPTYWDNLEGLDNALVDIWREPAATEDTFAPFEEWVNLNSFVSRLLGASLVDHKWSFFAIWAMRDSLEWSDVPVKDLLECRIAVVEQWIKYASQLLLQMMHSEPSERDRRPLRSSFFEGDKVLSLQRWEFWKQKLQEVAQLDVSEGVKATASRCVRAMDATEAEAKLE